MHFAISFQNHAVSMEKQTLTSLLLHSAFIYPIPFLFLKDISEFAVDEGNGKTFYRQRDCE